MLSKLIRFVLTTRYSKQLLIFLTLIVVYDFFLGFVARLKPIPAFSDYAVLSVTGFSITGVALGGLVVMSSDRDYLFTLPLPKSQLALAVFIAQFVSMGFSLMMFLGFYVPVLSEPPVVSVSYVVLLGLFMTALSTCFSRS
ncbi:MAG: hypothetical protein QW767_03545, partial [Thermoprotei archaeon]